MSYESLHDLRSLDDLDAYQEAITSELVLAGFPEPENMTTLSYGPDASAKLIVQVRTEAVDELRDLLPDDCIVQALPVHEQVLVA